MNCNSHKVVRTTTGLYDKVHHAGEHSIPATALANAECKNLVVATADYANYLFRKIISIVPGHIQYALDRKVLAAITSWHTTYIAERSK